MSIDAPGVLRHAADLLTGVADDLLSCNATADGVWDDADLEAEFSDLDNTSALLRVLADRAERGISADAAMSTLAETIHWIRAADELPDTDTTVLVYGRAYDSVFMGFYETFDDECWRDTEGFRCEDEITHWAHVPDGPEAGPNISSDLSELRGPKL